MLLKMEQPPQKKTIDICLGYLVVGLDQQHLVVEVFEAGLDHQLDTRELPSIAAHALL